ncbi:hypothetical protein NPIL_237821 [Nephila pilipes]|uniref:Uncharacterized protein n=1 Tax=Nephila pilipes TaxID=299642 RepID=A0A8X6R036_NEPPI|nr:hypothetical protein NPIL_237821 [Nephila pilipes]
MYICSDAQYNSTTNVQYSSSLTVSFKDGVLLVADTWHYPYERSTLMKLEAKPELVRKHHTVKQSGSHDFFKISFCLHTSDAIHLSTLSVPATRGHALS